MKPRRDITLGEMQDECKGHVFCSECKYSKICMYDRQVSMNEIDLTDPTRFTEAQMAFLRGWYEMGFKKLSVIYNGNLIFERSDGCVCVIENYAAVMINITLKIGETLDLAELFGKDGKE